MLNNNNIANKYMQIAILIFQFWLSGLFIIGTIFVLPQQIQSLTLYAFLAVSIGSFLGGILADSYGRKPIFRFASFLLLFSSLILQINAYYGFILAAFAIGPLNNITFVLLMQGFPKQKDLYTIFVLIGWASSQVFLGIFFFLGISIKILFLVIFMSTLIYTLSAILFIEQTQNQSERVAITFRNIIPIEFKPLISGCILMFTMQMFYYRTQFTLDKFGISLPINTLVVGCTEIIANIILTKYLKFLPRKRSLQVLVLFLIGLLVLLLTINAIQVQTVLEGVMRLGDTAIMIILGVYLPQQFSEGGRARGTNFVMAFGVIGSACSQYILNSFPFWSLTLFLVLALLSTIFMKQTLSKANRENEQIIIRNTIQY